MTLQVKNFKCGEHPMKKVPACGADLEATIKRSEFGVTLTPRGAGTSQAGQAVGAGVQLDCSKYLNRVLEIDADGIRAEVLTLG